MKVKGENINLAVFCLVTINLNTVGIYIVLLLTTKKLIRQEIQ
jgi:hypothetical protein